MDDRKEKTQFTNTCKLLRPEPVCSDKSATLMCVEKYPPHKDGIVRKRNAVLKLKVVDYGRYHYIVVLFVFHLFCNVCAFKPEKFTSKH